MLKQIRMKEWRSHVSQQRILREITNQMFTQPDPSHLVGSTPTYPHVTVHSIAKKKCVPHGGLHWHPVGCVNAAWVPHGDHTQRWCHTATIPSV
jgi:hypothetical protein